MKDSDAAERPQGVKEQKRVLIKCCRPWPRLRVVCHRGRGKPHTLSVTLPPRVHRLVLASKLWQHHRHQLPRSTSTESSASAAERRGSMATVRSEEPKSASSIRISVQPTGSVGAESIPSVRKLQLVQDAARSVLWTEQAVRTKAPCSPCQIAAEQHRPLQVHVWTWPATCCHRWSP